MLGFEAIALMASAGSEAAMNSAIPNPYRPDVPYAVPTIPSAVVRTAAQALNNALLTYIQAIADMGLNRAAACDPVLARGVETT